MKYALKVLWLQKKDILHWWMYGFSPWQSIKNTLENPAGYCCFYFNNFSYTGEMPAKCQRGWLRQFILRHWIKNLFD